MAHVLETRDLDNFLDSQGVFEWGNVMFVEIDSTKKNHIWKLVPLPQGNNFVKH